jgi:hypothetical protein
MQPLIVADRYQNRGTAFVLASLSTQRGTLSSTSRRFIPSFVPAAHGLTAASPPQLLLRVELYQLSPRAD